MKVIAETKDDVAEALLNQMNEHDYLMESDESVLRSSIERMRMMRGSNYGQNHNDEALTSVFVERWTQTDRTGVYDVQGAVRPIQFFPKGFFDDGDGNYQEVKRDILRLFALVQYSRDVDEIGELTTVIQAQETAIRDEVPETHRVAIIPME